MNKFCPSLLAKSQKKVNLPKRLATCETSAIRCIRYDNCLDVAKGMFGLGKKTCISLSFCLFMKSKGANFA